MTLIEDRRRATVLRDNVSRLLLAALLATGCAERAAPPPDPEPALDLEAAKSRAAALMGQFRYGDTVEKLRELNSTPAAAADDRVDLAIALLNRRQDDDLAEAASLLDGVIAQAPDNLRAKYCRALLLFNDGEMQRAQELFEAVAEGDPDDAYAAYYVGQSYFSRGEYPESVPWFRRARETDAYLRSASYGLFQALRRTGDSAEAKEAFEVFQRLAENPRSRLAELKYTRMGPKAEVRAGEADAAPAQRPAGPLFQQARPLVQDDTSLDWDARAAGNVTAADLDGDGLAELFLAGALEGGRSVVLRQDGGAFAPVADHPLAAVEGVNTALWGDFDNDGLVDAYLCRRGPNVLMRQGPVGEWSDATKATGTAGGGHNTVDGLCYDVDHDGDLDYLLVNVDGPRELLNNDRDGGFREIAAELEIQGSAAGSQRVAVADLDGDDDADLVFLNESPPHEVLLNDRLWNFSAAEGFAEFTESSITACVAADTDVDGQSELFTAGPDGVRRWAPDADGRWVATALTDTAASNLACYDSDGDTRFELFVREAGRWLVVDVETGDAIHDETLNAGGGLHLLVGANGPEVIVPRRGESPLVWRAGEGRHPFALVTLVGKTDKAAEMRSNASGVGVRGVARVGRRWAPLPEGKAFSSAGHSLQPHAIGSGGAAKLDFVRLLWPDGVSQTELDLAVGVSHTLPETQRQAGSCPLVFVWDGQRDRFIADLLGAGGLGFNLGRGEYYPPRPAENLLLPEGCLAPRDGSYTVRLGEPMEEVCYFDAVRLVAYDLPPGWSMTLDERFAGLGPAPTGEPVFFRRELLPARATNDRGDDITEALRAEDGEPAPLARVDRRFIGLCEPHSVVIEFDEPLDSLNAPTLRFHGWVEYAYSQSAFAAWQAGEEFLEPTIKARDAAGEWVVVAERFGYPAGTQREGSTPLDKSLLPKETTALRVSTNMQVYWDRLSVVDREPCPAAERVEAELLSATVGDVGFSARVIHPHRRPVYDYASRPPFGDARHPAGFYTAFGEAVELVSEVDDAVAIIGPGEEVRLEFAAHQQPPASGGTRRWVLQSNGWCKDADLFTQNSGTVGPLPTRSGKVETTPRREKLHADYNTRFRSGY